jgi:hypothetical protein
MKRWAPSFVVALAILAGSAFCRGADGGTLFQVDYSNPGLIPAQWTLEIHPDGSAHFKTERGNAPSQEIESADIDRDVQLSAEFAAHVFSVIEPKAPFPHGCESPSKVAFQGMKKLTYMGPGGPATCEFNYAKDKDIQSLTDSLISVATTLIEGARLQTLLLHDRLGLDRETQVLVESAKDGRAQQIGSIRDILERLAQDPAVLERVKRRARILLTKADSGA